ncbi:MAG: DUF6364 family protein [Cyclobacteriaceae bacterium]
MKNITLSVPEDLLRKAREYASRNGTSVNQMVRDLLRHKIEPNKSPFLERLNEFRMEIQVDTYQLDDRDSLYER